jgi:hypothetical protein
MIKLILFILSFTISVGYGQITINGTTITEAGGRPASCPIGQFKIKHAGSNTGNCIELTPNTNNFLSGAFWYCTQLNLNESFRFDFSLNFGSNTLGGDGMAFVLQNEGVSDVKGGAGGGLGYAEGDGNGCLSSTPNDCPIRNSIAIEYDTWDNTVDGLNDISCNHTSMQTNGEMVSSNTIAGPVCLTSAGVSVVDGNNHNVCITWDPILNELTTSFDGIKILTYYGDIRSILGTNTYWGFTAASGGVAQSQSVCNVNLLTNIPNPDCATILSNELINFDINCVNNITNLYWSVENKNEIDYFKILESEDGITFNTIGEVTNTDNLGNSSYNYSVGQIKETMYYKLETTNIDGVKSISKILSSNCNSNSNENVYVYPNPTNEKLTVVNRKQKIVTIKLIDVNGCEIYNKDMTQSYIKELDVLNISSGVYGVKIENVDGSSHLIHFIKN